MRSRIRSARKILASIARCTCVRVDQRLAGLARPVIGLAQQVAQVVHAHGELFGIARQARALLDQARHGVTVERQQVLLARKRGDQPRVQPWSAACRSMVSSKSAATLNRS